MSAAIALLGAAEVPAADVVAVYQEAFGAGPYFEGEDEVRRFADVALPRHLERRDFRLALARSEDGAVAGFAYGYTGGRLHDALLAGLPHRTALLSTRDADTPARRLYARRGWVTLREGLGAGPDRPGVLLMGLRLRA